MGPTAAVANPKNTIDLSTTTMPPPTSQVFVLFSWDLSVWLISDSRLDHRPLLPVALMRPEWQKRTNTKRTREDPRTWVGPITINHSKEEPNKVGLGGKKT